MMGLLIQKIQRFEINQYERYFPPMIMMNFENFNFLNHDRQSAVHTKLYET